MHTASPVAREKLFNMRMSAEEWARLDSLAEHYSLNAAGIVRMLVKERFDALKRENAPREAPTASAKPAKKSPRK